MNARQKKQAVGRAAVELVRAGDVLGVGTGSTVNCFIEALADAGVRIEGAVASSVASERRLRERGLPVVDLRRVGRVPLYVDGADEATRECLLIKGGGGALTREKIVAAASERFVCLIDDSKLVRRLGAFPLPVEVIPMATVHVAAELRRYGGRAVEREGFVTDNGHAILDVSGLRIDDPRALESEIDHIAGVVSCGLFARRPADSLLVAGDSGVDRIERPGR